MNASYYLAIRIFCTTILCLLSASLHAQIKYEQESRIKRSDFPATALIWLAPVQEQAKLKYFREMSSDGLSYEAKFKYHKERYSVEFDSTGQLQDIEKTVAFTSLLPDTQDRLCATLKEKYTQFRVRKTQIQWTGNEDQLVAQIVNPGSRASSVITRYELIVEAKLDKQWSLYELLIAADGRLIRADRIVERSYQNLEF